MRTFTAAARRLPAFTHSIIFFVPIVLMFSAACRQDMQDQPKMKPFRSSTFFRDGLASRQPVEGTVPRGFLRTDSELFTGKKSQKQLGTSGQAALAQATPGQTVAGPHPSRATPNPASGGVPAAAYPDDVETFPFPITQSILERGKQRYEIFCSVCHGMTGDGDGLVVRRGFRRAASFNDDRLRQAPVGHFFDAVTNGWGAMPSYASQIPVQDRWAIIGYIRALQVSQQNQQLQSIQPAPPGTSPSPQTGGRQR